MHCTAPGGLVGCPIHLPFPSVGATECVMLAACTAKGVTTLMNAAREPEIGDLADFLNAVGGKVLVDGNGTVTVEGVPSLHSAAHTVIPDRIVASTYMSAAAITGVNCCCGRCARRIWHRYCRCFRRWDVTCAWTAQIY